MRIAERSTARSFALSRTATHLMRKRGSFCSSLMTPVPTVPSPITPTLILPIGLPQLSHYRQIGERSRSVRLCATVSILTMPARVPRMDTHSYGQGKPHIESHH